MELVSVECPSCGASLPPAEPTGGYQCEYCGERFELARARGAKTQAGMAVDPRELARAFFEQAKQAGAGQAAPRSHGAGPDATKIQAQAVKTAASAMRKVVSLFVFLIILGALVPIVVVMIQTQAGNTEVGDMIKKVPGLAQVTEKLEHLLWDNVGGMPVPVTIGGKPGFIGRTRRVLGGDALFMDAHDAATGERIWRIEDLGDYSGGYQHTRFGVLGETLVLSDYRAQLHLHDVNTGARNKTLKLTDKVEYICVPPEADATQVWVEQVDNKSHLLDVGTGELTPAKRPDWCARNHHAAMEILSGGELRFAKIRFQGEKRKKKPKKLKVKGVSIERQFIDGDLGVAMAVKNPGTPIPRAIGYDPETNEVKWDEVVPAVDVNTVRSIDSFGALAGGRYFTVYGEGQDTFHLTALDATSGTRLWDVTLRGLFAVDRIYGMTATDTHVYVVRTSSLEVYDAKSGTLTATIGQETYDE